MRKADNTIVFGSQTAPMQPVSHRLESGAEVRPTPSFPDPVSPATRSAHPTPAFFVDSVRPRKLSEDLVDERSYMTRPERGLAFVAVSLALIGVAAAGTYFFLGSRREPVISNTTTTSAELPPATTAEAVPATPAPAPTTEPPTPTATPAATTPSGLPEVDAVRAPELGARPQAAKTQAPKETPGPQVAPTERQEASNQAGAGVPAPYAAKIQAAQFPGAPSTAKESKPPPAGMSDEALERSGYYGRITPIEPTAPTSGSSDEPKAPSAASTEEPKQFTPPPSPVMPDVKIKE